MALGTLVLVASTWLAGTSASYASVNRVNIQLTMGTSPRPGHEELVHLTEGSINPPEDYCPVSHEFVWACKDQGSFAGDIYECPSLDGNTRITPNDDRHKLHCSTQTARKDLPVEEEVTTNTLVACVDICSENEECVGVEWNRRDFVCSLKSEYMTDSYPAVHANYIDSSSEVCPRYDLENEGCPSGKIRCIFGEQFRFYSGLALMSANLVAVDAQNLQVCMRKCAEMPACKGADYIRARNKCYTKSAYVDVATTVKPTVDSFVLVQRRPSEEQDPHV